MQSAPKENIPMQMQEDLFTEDLQLLTPIKQLISSIEQENVKLQTLLESLTNNFQSVINYNQDLIRHLEVFTAKVTLDWKKILSEPFQQVKDMQAFEIQQQKCKDQFKNLEAQIQIIQKCQYVFETEQAFKEIIEHTSTKLQNNQMNDQDLCIDFNELKMKNDLYSDEILQQYLTFSKNTRDQLKTLISAPRNYVIKNKTNLAKILAILNYETVKKYPEALLVSAFLHLKGIITSKNSSKAFVYFKQCVEQSQDYPDANYFCYKLSDKSKDKYAYLGKTIIQNHPIIFATLAYIIGSGELIDEQLRNKMTAMLYQVSAEKGNPVSLSNYAMRLETGKGVQKDRDLSAEYYYKAVQKGNFESRQWLDSIIPKTKNFAKNHPEYQILKGGNHKEYCKQEIILL